MPKLVTAEFNGVYAPYPIHVSLVEPFGDDHNTRALSVEEAKAFRAELDAVIEQVESRGFVRVQVKGRSTWTYRDPSESLQVGDRVLVPFGFTNEEYVGVVTSLGRGGYTGKAKTVNAKLLVEELS